MAPDFRTVDFRGNSVSLSSHSGKQTLLCFFRGAACPFCNMRLHELIEAYPELSKNGLNIITVFSSTATEIAEFSGRQAPPFPIIPDPALDLYRKYGVEQSGMGLIKTMMRPKRMWQMMTSEFFDTKAMNDRPIIPADFLIDSELQISRAYYGQNFSDHIPISEIKNWLKK